jgi:maltose O-acetyltransferase
LENRKAFKLILMNKIIFKLGGVARPVNNRIQSALFIVNRSWILRKLDLFRRMLCKSYKIPVSTSFNKDFYCSAPNLFLGENVGLADTFILAYAPVTIGHNCSFSFRNVIITSGHDFGDFSTVVAAPVTIGNNVWITTNVTILPGVSIGDNTVIGAGSVVTKSVPSNVFAAGNPCIVIKEIEFNK